MSTISVDVSSSKIPVLQVGYQGENEVTEVLFNISSWIEEYGGGTAQIRVKRPQNSEDESYLLSLPISDGVATWTVTSLDTANKGNGKVQLNYLVGTAIKDSVIYPYKVGKSIVGADSPVDPYDSWIERSKAWAIGELLDDEEVPPSDETYRNNSKFYAEQADASAEEAETQAVEAKAQADTAKQYAHQFVGAPRAASASSAMTDHDLIYVFTGTTTSSLTNGHWYYWNGSAWTDGGVYNSTAFTTDTTLSVSGAAADAKVVGDLKEDLITVSNAVVGGEISTGWVRGSVYVPNGTELPTTNRIKTDLIQNDISYVSVHNGYSYYICCYDNNNTYLGVYHNGEIVIPDAVTWLETPCNLTPIIREYKIKIVLRKNDDVEITIAASSNIDLYAFVNKKLPDAIIEKESFSSALYNSFILGSYELQTITWGYENKYINCNNGVITDAGSNWNVHVSDYIDCSDIKGIRYTGSPIYTFACLAFYDESRSFIQAYPASSSTVNFWMKEIEVPSNAKYVVFGNNSGESGRLPVRIEYMTNYGSKSFRPWIGKKWACVGDSLTEINNKASMRYMDYIQIETGITTYNMGKSGTGYANGHATGIAFLDRIVNVPTDSDVVTIFGSNNDMFGDNWPIGNITDQGTSTLCGYINETIDALYETFPQAILGIITPSPWENIYPSAATTVGQKGIEYCQALVDICKHRGIPCLDLFHCSGMRPWESAYRNIYYTNDEGAGVHPNELGHKILASHIKEFLKTLLV